MLINFELFRPELERVAPRADRSKAGRPPLGNLLMLKVLILQTQNTLSDERTESYCRRSGSRLRADEAGLDTPPAALAAI